MLSALGQVSAALNQSLELDDLLGAGLASLVAAIRIPQAAIYAQGHGDPRPLLRAAHNLPAGLVARGREGEPLYPPQIEEAASPVLLGEADALPDLARAAGIGSLTCVPCVARTRLLAVLCLASPRGQPLALPHPAFLSAIAHQIALAVDHNRLYAAQKEAAEIANALVRASSTLASLTDRQAILDAVLRLCGELLGDEHVAVHAAEGSELTEVPLALAGPIAEVRQRQRPLALKGVNRPECEPRTSLLIAPMIAADRLAGVIVVEHANPQHRFSAREIALVTGIANQAGTALQNAALLRAHQAQADELRQFRRLAEASLDAINISTLDGAVTYANRAWADLFGLGDPPAPGALNMRDLLPPRERERYEREIMPRVLTAGWSGEMEIQRADGVVVPVWISSAVIRGGLDEPLARFNIIRDLRERKRLEQQAALTDAAREADRLKSELLSTVSHELRTPLGSIKGHATALLRYGTRLPIKEQHEFLRAIDRASDKLRELIEHLLQLSRLEAGGLPMERQPCDLGALAREAVEELRPHLTEHHPLLVKLVEPLPTLQLDPRRIREVIDNLLDNAVKYSPLGGEITVEVAPVAGDDGRPVTVRLAVRDHGIGIPAEHHALIFERFHRVDSSLTRSIGGTGLGLAICRKIVEAHGGEITVESAPGEGSTFLVTLPIGTERPAGAEAQTGTGDGEAPPARGG